ncbi:hypothetical protein PFICI_00998 [Pestalotiopsis fici W106-1]|uniref:Heterokaryon incompatibility domain-containing protein n=1 Tax=Pestalotiopsis fici (strain W106-1 / CGMCC3.15140) TaxID=1229662 RepID=W3XMH8_PESFW|nr:uncharacterized protein PFICI_00998 [Pestalotiopsis fici W106-1]ETS87170.1 hypothetical protein PFICI_00998 [Pestalotiopsis fici W106-1]
MNDMIYDGFESLQSIDLWPNQTTGGRLLLHMEMAQALMQPQSSYHGWLQHLRFVVEVSHEDTDHAYELIESTSLDDLSEPYIAISYRWPENKSGVLPAKHHILAGTPRRPGEKFWRPVNAPIDVLRRAFAFARAHGIRKIWIDQECIDQEDEDEVAQAIQSMHVVYRQAAIVLAVLGHHVTNRADINALEKLAEMGDGAQVTLRERVMGDSWWTRAWAAQEMGVATYDQLRFMVGWHESLDTGGTWWRELTERYNQSRDAQDQQNVSREWVLRGNQPLYLNMLAGGSPKVLYGLVSGFSHPPVMPATVFALLTGYRQFQQECSPGANETFSTDGMPKMPIFEAVRLLAYKECLKVSDKLAMLGNLADFEQRIDRTKAVKLQLGFTACALALALYNGNVNPLFSSLHELVQELANTANRGLVSWLPSNQLSLEDLSTQFEFSHALNSMGGQSCKALVLDGKLATKGFMWEISEYRGFQGIAKQMQMHQDPTLRLQLLLRTLCRSGRHDLLAIMITLRMFRPIKSPGELVHHMLAIQEWSLEMRPWPAQVFSGYVNFTDHEPWKIITAICTEIAAGRPLLLGSYGKGDDELTCLCLGPLNTKQVFSPLSSLSCEFTLNQLEHLARTTNDNRHWYVESTSGRVSQRLQEKLLEHLDDNDPPSSKVFRIRGTTTVIINPFFWVPIAHNNTRFQYRFKTSGKYLQCILNMS